MNKSQNESKELGNFPNTFPLIIVRGMNGPLLRIVLRTSEARNSRFPARQILMADDHENIPLILSDR